MRTRWLPLSALLGLSVGTTAGADFVAYSVSGDGRKPLPETIDGIDAAYLVNVEWGDYAGRRPTVGVLRVENNTALETVLVSAALTGDQIATSIPVNGIESIITDALNRSNRFRLVERNTLESVLEEQDLSASGRVTEQSGAATGNILGAEFLVQVVVTDYQPDTEGRDLNVGGLLRDRVPLLGGLNVNKSESRVGMNFRLIDAETSEIIFTKQIESTIKESGVDLGALAVEDDIGLGGFLSDYSETPVGQATIAAINKGVYELIKQIGTRPTEGSVVTVNADQVYINLGQGSASVGERFRVLQQGEELIDPDTGISLGAVETVRGEVEVVEVRDRFSIARVSDGSQVPERGDKVVSTAEPPALEFAGGW